MDKVKIIFIFKPLNVFAGILLRRSLTDFVLQFLAKKRQVLR